MDNKLTKALGFIDNILTYKSFVELCDIQTNHKEELKGGLKDNYN